MWLLSFRVSVLVGQWQWYGNVSGCHNVIILVSIDKLIGRSIAGSVIVVIGRRSLKVKSRFVVAVVEQRLCVR